MVACLILIDLAHKHSATVKVELESCIGLVLQATPTLRNRGSSQLSS